MRPLNRPASQQEQAVETAASNVFDLQGFEDGFGANRDPKRKPPGGGWTQPTLRDGAEYQTGDVRIKKAGATGGFFNSNNVAEDSNGERIEIEVYRDGGWQKPSSDQEASRIMGMIVRQSESENAGPENKGPSMFTDINDVDRRAFIDKFGSDRGQQYWERYLQLIRRSDEEALQFAGEMFGRSEK